MGMFGGIKDAKPSMDANYDRDGDYIVRINRVKKGKSRNGDEFVVIEKTVLHVYDDAEGRGHKVGEDASHMMMTKHDSFLGNFKAFVANVLGVGSDEIDEEACEEICSDTNPLGGMVVHTVNRTIQTRKGTDFTKVSYKGEVAAADLANTLPPEALARFFPDDELQKLAARQGGN